MQQKVFHYENILKKADARQKIRGKELNEVLETGEKAELYKEFFEISTEINLYTQRYTKLQELNEKTAQSYKDITEKFKEFEKSYKKLKKLNDYTAIIFSDTQPLSENLEKTKKKEKAINEKYNTHIKAYSIKIKKLEEELSKSKKTESDIAADIEKKDQENKAKQLEIYDLQIKAISNNPKKNINHSSMNDELMFITEKIL